MRGVRERVSREREYAKSEREGELEVRERERWEWYNCEKKGELREMCICFGSFFFNFKGV